MGWTLVTGGAKRLGAHLCEALAQQGYSVVVHYRTSEEDAQIVAERCQQQGVQAATIQGDFSSLEAINDFIRRYLERFPDTQHVIHNVGNYLVRSALKTAPEEWMSLFQTNVHAPFILTQALVPSINHYKGCIINIGTHGLLKMQAYTYAAAYMMTKMSLWMLTRSLAFELAPQGVRVNMISPGFLDISVDQPQHAYQMPMGRPAYCEEVGRVVLFLLDPASAYITGQDIEVAGGTGLK